MNPNAIYTFIIFIIVAIGSFVGGVITEETKILEAIYVGFIVGFIVDYGFTRDGGSSAAVLGMSKGLFSVKKDMEQLKSKGGPGTHKPPIPPPK